MKIRGFGEMWVEMTLHFSETCTAHNGCGDILSIERENERRKKI